MEITVTVICFTYSMSAHPAVQTYISFKTSMSTVQKLHMNDVISYDKKNQITTKTETNYFENTA